MVAKCATMLVIPADKVVGGAVVPCLNDADTHVSDKTAGRAIYMCAECAGHFGFESGPESA